MNTQSQMIVKTGPNRYRLQAEHAHIDADKLFYTNEKYEELLGISKENILLAIEMIEKGWSENNVSHFRFVQRDASYTQP